MKNKFPFFFFFFGRDKCFWRNFKWLHADWLLRRRQKAHDSNLTNRSGRKTGGINIKKIRRVVCFKIRSALNFPKKFSKILLTFRYGIRVTGKLLTPSRISKWRPTVDQVSRLIIFFFFFSIINKFWIVKRKLIDFTLIKRIFFFFQKLASGENLKEKGQSNRNASV